MPVGPFNALKHDLAAYLEHEQIDAVHKAYLLAEKAHQGQKRYSGEEYITHPVAVARILASMHMDHQSIMAAILHDVIEDTSIDKNKLTEHFGKEVAELVDGVTKLTQIKFESRAIAQAEYFRKMVLAMSRDIRVILIKLSDRLHNMRSLGVLPAAKRQRIARETLEIYAPIANRLGMHKFFIEFEDLGFVALYPLRYRILQQAVQKARGNRREIMAEIEKSLQQTLEKHNITYIDILGREKHLYSIYKKMRHKKIPFAEIMDVYAFRIIVPEIDACYRALGAVHQIYKPVPERFKDYIAIPKANNYQSLHTTLFGPYGVPIEIQIRTQDMNRVAENGIASHWIYKSSDTKADETQLRAREWLKRLLEMQQSSKSPLEFIENVKIDLFPDEVYVFTPMGDIMELPAGATAVDFAYAVHSDVGDACIATKINRRLAPLSTTLANGQTVEVITAPGARPNPAWLNFVVTGKARSNIRHYMKERQREESISFGKQLLEKACLSMAVTLDEITQENKNAVIKALNYANFDELLTAIGLGNQLSLIMAQKLLGEETPTPHKQKTQPIPIKGTQGMVVNFALCCRPIPGDPIIGVFSRGQGLVIHRAQCPRISHLCAKPDQCLEVRWEEGIQREFQVDLKIEVANQRGTLAKLASAISAADANIDDIVVNSHEGRFSTVDVTISVRNRMHLARAIRRIRAIKDVTRLTRKM